MNTFKKIFSLDIRSLALFRIGLGTILLIDLGVRAFDLKAHYSDLGVFPISEIPIDPLLHIPLSLHAINGSVSFQAALFLLSAVFAVMVLVGYRTRWACFISYVLLLSLFNRNPYVANGGDYYFRFLFFWGFFLPLNACWSVDHHIQKFRQKSEGIQVPQAIFSLGSVGLILQICSLYWTINLIRWPDPIWFKELTAIYYALSMEYYAKDYSSILLNYPSFLKLLTFLTNVIEILGPALLLIPFRQQYIRLFVVVSFLIYHGFMAILLTIGIHPYVEILGWIALFPSIVWNKKDKNIPIRTIKNSFKMKFLITFLIFQMIFLNIIFAFQIKNIFQFNNLSKIIQLTKIMGVYPRWYYMSPHPHQANGWFVIWAKLSNGDIIDLQNNGESISWNKPASVNARYGSIRWRRWLTQDLSNESYKNYAYYLLEKWNNKHSSEKQVVDLKMYYMKEHTLLDRTQEIIKRNEFNINTFEWIHDVLPPQ